MLLPPSCCVQVPAVVCCRVTPGQKAEVTRLVKETGRITLAIGDGGVLCWRRLIWVYMYVRARAFFSVGVSFTVVHTLAFYIYIGPPLSYREIL